MFVKYFYCYAEKIWRKKNRLLFGVNNRRRLHV